MNLHSDFSKRVLLHASDLPWQASPMAGVSRRMLDRLGGEVARATTIVRYDPNSKFSPHTHTGGEEFVVLEGVFQDEHGDYPAGSYVRNPPQSRHEPGSEPGCVIFVKLWQFQPDDRTFVRTPINGARSVPEAGRPGVRVTPLFEDPYETVRAEVWEPGAQVQLAVPGGAELLVLQGSLRESGDELATHSWLRLPAGGLLQGVAGPKGAHVWMKIGHLANAERLVAPKPA